MDGLLRQVVDELDAEQEALASDRFDVLVTTFPELRLDDLGRYPGRVRALLARLDPEAGPLIGFEEAMIQLCDLCITPLAVRGLRSQLYTVAARVADACPDLLPTVALAALSLDAEHPKQSPFVEMVVCASAIEWLVAHRLQDSDLAFLDVGVWLAAEPSQGLRAAIGEGRAHYYAAIPGLLPFLNERCALFDVHDLAPYADTLSRSNGHPVGDILLELATREYKALLCAEVRRVRTELRWRYPAKAVAGVVMLADRALEALDDLPPQVNPLLQAALVQSWVRYLDETCC
jgi:hypothetical protein